MLANLKYSVYICSINTEFKVHWNINNEICYLNITVNISLEILVINFKAKFLCNIIFRDNIFEKKLVLKNTQQIESKWVIRTYGG